MLIHRYSLIGAVQYSRYSIFLRHGVFEPIDPAELTNLKKDDMKKNNTKSRVRTEIRTKPLTVELLARL